MTFGAAVRAAGDISGSYRKGLSALKGEHRPKMKRKNAQCRWRGSVDLDVALSARFPNAFRWDYAVGYGYQNRPDGVAFVEVHRASSSDVDDVLRKKEWLTSWMGQNAPDLAGLPRGGFFWVATGSVHIHPGTRQHRLLAQGGITVGKVATIG